MPMQKASKLTLNNNETWNNGYNTIDILKQLTWNNSKEEIYNNY